MKSDRNGLTLIEVTVCIALISFVCIAASGISSHLSEEARTAKCQSNLKRQIDAIFQYTADYDGVLPGPAHPTIKRHLYDLTGVNSTDKKKSLTWLLRPYFPEVGDSTTNPATANPIVDEVFRCPTASMIAPDSVFLEYDTGSCWKERPYNYVCNTWGPNGTQGSTFYYDESDWQSTDPPHYFGVWYFCDSNPETQDSRVCWKPKRLEVIANAAAEWATSDAWYRRVGGSVGRGGTVKRRWLGTFAPRVQPYFARIPSAPYHRAPIQEARSHASWGVTQLPEIEFSGETNQAYFDGHVAPFKGQWNTLGDGGSVNPYWEVWGGSHPFSEPWSTAVCNQEP